MAGNTNYKKQGSRRSSSGRSSPGKKLKTETTAKKASGEKLRGENAAQLAAGDKLRFDKAVFADEAVKGVSEGTSHGRKTPKGSRASTLMIIWNGFASLRKHSERISKLFSMDNPWVVPPSS